MAAMSYSRPKKRPNLSASLSTFLALQILARECRFVVFCFVLLLLQTHFITDNVSKDYYIFTRKQLFI